ncbi:hypothetical protein PLESTF_000556800 [Pleodorina starrii]|nr:hypothetical protein PLESTF_000556800 [Pleodorina starrii]
MSRPAQRLAEVLPLLARLSPHVAAHLSRSNVTMATLFMPSAEAFASYLDSAGDLAAMDLPALIALYRQTLTVIAYHSVPGGSAKRTLSAAALTAAAAAAGGGAASLSSLVPGATLGVMLLSGWVRGSARRVRVGCAWMRDMRTPADGLSTAAPAAAVAPAWSRRPDVASRAILSHVRFGKQL